LRSEDGITSTDFTFDYLPTETKTFATHGQNAYNLDDTLSPGTVFRQGSAVIFATTTNVHCTVAQIDASSSVPSGTALRLVRFRPANNSQEDSRAATDPLRVIYRVSGVLDSGDAASGVGTSTTFICTNFSNVPEKLRIILRPETAGTNIINTFDLASGETFTASTHFADAYSENFELSPGTAFRQASALIAATTTNMHCTATHQDASLNFPNGIELHLVRIRPANNSQE
jgi:hypothetical protein